MVNGNFLCINCNIILFNASITAFYIFSSVGFAIRISGKKIFLLDTITTVAHRELVQLASNFINNELLPNSHEEALIHCFDLFR